MGFSHVGFFRELRHGMDDGPSLRESVRDSAQPDEAGIVRYLNAGESLAVTGSLVDDYLDDSRTGVSRLEIATDGHWVWPRDLAYYVQEYHVELPAEFVEHMRQRDWDPPRFTQEELEKLVTEYDML